MLILSRPFFRRAIFARQVGRTDLVLMCDRSDIISRSVNVTNLCVQRLRFVPPYIQTHMDVQRAF